MFASGFKALTAACNGVLIELPPGCHGGALGFNLLFAEAGAGVVEAVEGGAGAVVEAEAGVVVVAVDAGVAAGAVEAASAVVVAAVVVVVVVVVVADGFSGSEVVRLKSCLEMPDSSSSQSFRALIGSSSMTPKSLLCSSALSFRLLSS